MKGKITEHGLLIPKEWFPHIQEVEIARENGRIIVTPLEAADPIRELGKHPIVVEVDDASAHHDRVIEA